MPTSVAAGEGTEPFSPSAHDEARWALRQVYYRERTWFATHGVFTQSLADLGLAGLSVPGYSSLQIETTRGLFEAAITSPDGRRIQVQQDGRVW